MKIKISAYRAVRWERADDAHGEVEERDVAAMDYVCGNSPLIPDNLKERDKDPRGEYIVVRYFENYELQTDIYKCSYTDVEVPAPQEYRRFKEEYQSAMQGRVEADRAFVEAQQEDCIELSKMDAALRELLRMINRCWGMEDAFSALHESDEKYLRPWRDEIIAQNNYLTEWYEERKI